MEPLSPITVCFLFAYLPNTHLLLVSNTNRRSITAATSFSFCISAVTSFLKTRMQLPLFSFEHLHRLSFILAFIYICVLSFTATPFSFGIRRDLVHESPDAITPLFPSQHLHLLSFILVLINTCVLSFLLCAAAVTSFLETHMHSLLFSPSRICFGFCLRSPLSSEAYLPPACLIAPSC